MPDGPDSYSRYLIHDEEGALIMNFGKHQGEYVEDVDEDYIEWMWTQDFPEDVMEAIEEERR